MYDIAPLARHARRYGTDCIMDTAVEFGFAHGELCSLLVVCDEVDRKAVRFPKKHRLTVEQRVDRLLGIEDEKEAA